MNRFVTFGFRTGMNKWIYLVLVNLVLFSACVYSPTQTWSPHRGLSGFAYEEPELTHKKPERKHKKPKTRKDVADLKKTKN